MPFPLLKLPYGFQQRLHNLGKPTEVYKIQTAAGSEAKYLLPFIPSLGCLIVHDVPVLDYCTLNTLKLENGNFIFTQVVYVDKTTNEIKATRNYRCDEMDSKLVFDLFASLVFENMDPPDFEDPFLNRVIVEEALIIFTNCGINANVLRKFKSENCMLIKCVTMMECDCYEDVTLPVVFDCFPQIESLNAFWLTAKPNWVVDILNSKKTGLKILNFRGFFNDIFSFTPEEITQLFDTQDTNLLVCINCKELPWFYKKDCRYFILVMHPSAVVFTFAAVSCIDETKVELDQGKNSTVAFEGHEPSIRVADPQKQAPLETYASSEHQIPADRKKAAEAINLFDNEVVHGQG